MSLVKTNTNKDTSLPITPKVAKTLPSSKSNILIFPAAAMLVSFLLLIFASGLFDLDFLGLWG